ncbi:putative reductase [Labilithrix luteola]|uniref:Putative reductase n=2 Tax=Labilithrix luteola TaxID=1391654 RepID=A0A0K1QGA9_9BACT|nr:putative reductase [Labilithrix luteola]
MGLPVGQWFVEHAKGHGKFEVELVDLKEVGLPLIDEPKHPRLGQYEHEHTRRWSATVSASDAFVFVTPEYNYSSAPALLNALDFLYTEWLYKPCGFVSYGGVSGGLRSVQMTKLIVTSLKMVPLPEGVSIPFVAKHVDEQQKFKSDDHIDKSANVMLDELIRWTNAMKVLRS